MVTFSVEITPSLTPLIDWAHQTARRCQNLRGAWPYVEKNFRIETKAQFAGEGTSAGSSLGRWVELSESYKTWKEATHPGKPILQLTGTLRKAFVNKAGGQIKRTNMTWEFAPGVKTLSGWDLAGLHHTGTPDARNPMPARPPFRMPPEVARRVVAQPVIDFLCGVIGSGSTKRFPSGGGL